MTRNILQDVPDLKSVWFMSICDVFTGRPKPEIPEKGDQHTGTRPVYKSKKKMVHSHL